MEPLARKRHIVRDVRIGEVSFCPEGIQKQARVALLKAKMAKGEHMPTDSDQALEAIEALATSLRKATPSLTREQAIAQAVAENPALYVGYQALAAADRAGALAKAQDACAKAEATIETLAKARRVLEPALTPEQAIAAVIRERPELYAAYAHHARTLGA